MENLNPFQYFWHLYPIIQTSKSCLVLENYQGKKKNVKENDFLICGLHNRKYKRKPNIIKILKKKIYFLII